jgi:hypothetical protein
MMSVTWKDVVIRVSFGLRVSPSSYRYIERSWVNVDGCKPLEWEQPKRGDNNPA